MIIFQLFTIIIIGFLEVFLASKRWGQMCGFSDFIRKPQYQCCIFALAIETHCDSHEFQVQIRCTAIRLELVSFGSGPTEDSKTRPRLQNDHDQQKTETPKG